MINPTESENKYIIVTDTACDLSQEMLDSLGIIALPMHVIIHGEDYLHYADYRNLSKEDFFDMLKKYDDVTTSQVDLTAAEDTLRSLAESGKDILYIAFSSGLSGTYSAVKMIGEDLSEEFPERKIFVIDSLCASGGEGLLCYLAAKKKEGGLSIEELRDWIENNKLRICHWFTVDDLDHLKRGGRISAATATIGGLLKIKPIMYMDRKGHLTPNSKAAGRSMSLDAIANKMEKHSDTREFDTVMISQAQCRTDAETLKEKILSRFKIGEVIIVDIDPIIAAHTGKGCISLFFVGNER